MIGMAILWSAGLGAFCLALWMFFSLFGGQTPVKDSNEDATEKILERRLTAGEIGANLAVKSPSPFYPGFVVGDTSAARYLFLGAQPSYRSHIITATLEYHF